MPDDAFVRVAGGEVFTRRWSTRGSDLAPIVLLHDSLGSVEQWRNFPASLADATARTVIAYDRLGHGLSTRRSEPPSMGFIDEEADVHFPRVAEALGLTRFVLFGHSVGGGIALNIAAHDDRCEAVISESAQAFVEERTRAGIRAAKTGFAQDEQFAKLVKWHKDRARWVLDAWTETWLSPQFASWSLTRLDAVTCPVLAIHGETDEYGSLAFPEAIVNGVTGRAQLVITKTGHVPHREDPEAVLNAVHTFLEPD